jgi:nucleoside-diphosphate-sugar epimerase
MVGRKLAERLAGEPQLAGRPVRELILHDVVEPPAPRNTVSTRQLSGNLATEGEAERLAALRPDVVFHLAAIVSGEAERDFDLGWDVNCRAMHRLLEAIRAAGNRPRFIFSSSIAVFGAPFPPKIPDDFHCTPLTSYGAQKAIGELLVADFSRKGFIDGISLRLPTVCVRPGKANLAASSFFSGIIREPLNGQEAILPVSEEVRHWFASPRSTVGFLLHAAGLDLDRLNGRPSLTMPGLSCTVAEQIAALREIAGDKVANLIRRKPDATIDRIVGGWPRDFNARRAAELGFAAESDFRQIIHIYMKEDLGKAPAADRKTA